MAEPKNVKKCMSCGIPLIDHTSVIFDCPDCGKEKIGRCPQCRDQSVNYTCKGCGFVGP